MKPRPIVLHRMARFALAVAAASLLAACDDQTPGLSGRSLSPIPNDTLALMQQKGTSRDAPVLIRTYKQEAELEIWKQNGVGQYVYLKTFPMCRWSGQLGPKLRAGDRQVPEGFYNITPGQMNPNSHYYLSFNVGYPNAYDRAHGGTGGDIMVHGICSSAGCFSMTNDQIAEIYAIAREAFNGGQRAIQMQSFPFKMTAENLAKHRLDPHIAFWKMLKEGADNFEVTKQEPQVGVCAKHYVFNATPAGGGRLDPNEACPTLVQDETLKADVAAKQARDDAQVAELVAKGVKPIQLVYDDGGQNPVFYSKVADVSRPEGLASGPREVLLDEHGKPAKAPVVQVAAASSAPVGAAPVLKPASAVAANVTTQPITVASAATDQPFYKRMLGLAPDTTQQSAAIQVIEPAAPEPADVPLPPRRPGGAPALASARDLPSVSAQPAPVAASPVQSAAAAPSDQPFYKRWLGLAPEAPQPDAAAPAQDLAVPQPANVPLPPRRQAAATASKPQASLVPAGNQPNPVAGPRASLSEGFMALAPTP